MPKVLLRCGAILFRRRLERTVSCDFTKLFIERTIQIENALMQNLFVLFYRTRFQQETDFIAIYTVIYRLLHLLLIGKTISELPP